MKKKINADEIIVGNKISFFCFQSRGFSVINGTVDKVTDKTIEIKGKKYRKSTIDMVNLFD